ncbi:MAG TPA: Ig domain-containing protein [Candidatus Nanoarchaeia archaeon]|nr:Ig domain-containing protein [Candidatus Nanoarchaeia archaeon]
MQKRAIADNVFSYLLVAIVAIAIVAIGIGAVGSVKDRLCKADLAQFQLALSEASQEMRQGTVIEKTLDSPCGARRIYLFDSQDEVDPSWFDEYPLMQDSIKSRTGRNVFLIRDSNAPYSFEAPHLGIRHPNFACIVPQSGKISLRFERAGAKVLVDPACGQRLCSDIPQEFDPESLGDVFRESDATDCLGCIDDSVNPLEEEAKRAKLLYDHVKIFRRYEYCDGKLTMHLIFRPNDGVIAENFRFFEAIPKNCIENLDEVLGQMTQVENGISYVHADPLLMWGFTSLDGEQEVSYGLEVVLKDECTKAIEGAGVAQQIQRENVMLDPADLADDVIRSIVERRPAQQDRGFVSENTQGQTPPIDPQAATSQENEETAIAQTKPSLAFTSTPNREAVQGEKYRYEPAVNDVQANLFYSLTGKAGGMEIDSSTGAIDWIPSFDGTFDVEITVQDPVDGRIAEQRFSIRVEKKCIANFERKCFDGHVYQYDSCQKRGERESRCTFSSCKQRSQGGKNEAGCCFLDALNPFC